MAVGVVGLGNMGLGMAASLVRGGERVFGFDFDAGRCALAAEAGVSVSGDVGALIAACEVAVLSLPNGGAVGPVVDAFVAGAPADGVLVDTSTLDVAQARWFAERVSGSGRAMLDAPVSGGASGAAAGKLTMMVGGEAEALARVRPVLDKLAARIVHVGGPGAGQVAKLANNMLVAAHLVTAAEAVRMAVRAGVSAEAVLEVVNGASGRSAASEVNFPRWILSGSFDSGFATGLMRKDVGLAMDLARDSGADVPVCRRAALVWLEESVAIADAADFNRVPAAILDQA